MIRPATTDDVPAVVALVRDLARYERAEHEVRLTEESLRAALFGPAPAVWCTVATADPEPDSAARAGGSAGEVVGFAIWFLSFSTWLGRHGIYLEDLYVSPEHRGTGLGRELLAHLAATALERGYGRVEWSVLDWNEPAQGFYRSLGAQPMDEWTVWRLADEPLSTVGAGQ